MTSSSDEQVPAGVDRPRTFLGQARGKVNRTLAHTTSGAVRRHARHQAARAVGQAPPPERHRRELVCRDRFGCAAYPKADVVFLPPTGYVGTSTTQASLTATSQVTGRCPAQLSVAAGMWVRYKTARRRSGRSRLPGSRPAQQLLFRRPGRARRISPRSAAWGQRMADYVRRTPLAPEPRGCHRRR